VLPDIAAMLFAIGGYPDMPPSTIAAALVYMLSNFVKEPTTIEDVAGPNGVNSRQDIYHTYAYLYEHRSSLIDDDWVAEGMGELESIPYPEFLTFW
jgi:hypothetical protein